MNEQKTFTAAALRDRLDKGSFEQVSRENRLNGVEYTIKIMVEGAAYLVMYRQSRDGVIENVGPLVPAKKVTIETWVPA